MPLEYIVSSTIGLGVRIRRKYDDQDLHIAAGVLVASDDDTAISLTASYHDVAVLGQVRGAIYGIVLGNDMTADVFNSVTIAAGASVHAVIDALRFKSASGLVTNYGEIHAGATLSSDGIVIGGIGTGTSRIVNYGLIKATDQGVEVNDGTTEMVLLENYGTISGANDAYVGDVNIDHIINRGTIQGDIYLKAGDDIYDGRGGRLLAGTVYGGEGNDTFRPGDGAEVINGNAGQDTLDFRDGGGLRVSLADASGTGRAAGDVYSNIVRVLGSLDGADTLIGSSSANTLEGFGGQDALLGNGGNDLLVGGLGVDSLTGGSGNDAFQFASPDQGGDLIADFSNKLGNDDQILIGASGFGGGLVAGTTLAPAQFRTRTDNLAQDADDRFIFRSTDQTLWFDADGDPDDDPSNGASGAAAVLVADLQAGAVLSAADILLV